MYHCMYKVTLRHSLTHDATFCLSIQRIMVELSVYYSHEIWVHKNVLKLQLINMFSMVTSFNRQESFSLT